MESRQAIQPNEINEQVSRILDYGIFKKSPILSRFLTFIVGEFLASRAQALKEYTIGVEVLGRPTNFDPQIDAVVRIHAVRLRKALFEYYAGPGREDKIVVEIPKGAYIPAFYRKEEAYRENLPDPANKKTVLAIYPFLTPEMHLIGFGDGLCEALCNEFSIRPELSTISYYSSRMISEQAKELKNACQLLGADYILTGFLQPSQDLMRIGVQLVHCKSMHQVWGKTFDVQVQQIETLDLIDQIVVQTVNRIAGAHGVITREKAKAIKKSPQIAVNDVLYWYYRLVSHSDQENLRQAYEGVKQALQQDSSYALGWAILSEIFVASHFYGYEIGEATVLKKAIESGKTAISLDLSCDHAYQSLGLAYLFLQRQKECEGIVKDWQRLDSKSALTAGGLGFCLICLGELDEGFSMLEQSIKLNPYYPWWFNAALAIYHYMAGAHEEAIYWSEKLNIGSELWEHFLKMLCYTELGSGNDVKHHYTVLQSLVPDFWQQVSGLAKSFILSENILIQMDRTVAKSRSIVG